VCFPWTAVRTLDESACRQCCGVLQCIAVCCRALQCTAWNCLSLRGSVVKDQTFEPTLQHTATHCNALQHTATHCNTLQHTATHCNTLQHTATQCNTLHWCDTARRQSQAIKCPTWSWSTFSWHGPTLRPRPWRFWPKMCGHVTWSCLCSRLSSCKKSTSRVLQLILQKIVLQCVAVFVLPCSCCSVLQCVAN